MPAKRPEPSPKPDGPTFAMVERELTDALGKPSVKRGIREYPATGDTQHWIDRVHEAGGSAAVCAKHNTNYLCVVDGPPSALMDYVTWVSWQGKAVRNALDALHKEVGLRIADVHYTDFVMHLDRAPRDPDKYAKRFAKVVMNGDASKISRALAKRRWKTG